MLSVLLPIIYISFISLGLPDSLLGSAWPIIYTEINVPISYSGIIFMIISVGTVISSLLSDRIIRKLGTGKTTAISVAMTAIALFGFSISSSFAMLCLFAIPYGLGAGSVDAALNNYVAIHYESRHMSWLHCMWGVGASVGPYIMSAAITRYSTWTSGYVIIGTIQIILSAFLFLSLPLWKKSSEQISTQGNSAEQSAPLKLKDVLAIPGAKQIMITFFCYCAIEQTVGLWASSYLVLNRQINEVTASAYAGLFFTGITIGRAINGFLTYKLSDKSLIYLGNGIILSGLILMLIPSSSICALIGLIIIGLGCAPIYPCIIHSTPTIFGKDKSQAVVGIQMASAYVGMSIMPPLFGTLSNVVGIKTLPAFLLSLLALMFIMYKSTLNQVSKNK